MSTKLYVGNLNYQVTEDQLSGLFGPFGAIVSVKIILDKETGRSRGYGFVELENEDSAENAISTLDGKESFGRNLKINKAKEREDGANSRTGGQRNFSRNGQRNNSRENTGLSNHQRHANSGSSYRGQHLAEGYGTPGGQGPRSRNRYDRSPSDQGGAFRGSRKFDEGRSNQHREQRTSHKEKFNSSFSSKEEWDDDDNVGNK